MSYAIKVENLSKKYLIRHQGGGAGQAALRDVLTEGARRLGKRLLGQKVAAAQYSEEFWALKDVSFQVGQGERIGIIGRNGAGKSSLLKILSRITEPSAGGVRLRGRVASLLEVGTGFHPELTGRENIFLNGAIMGMSRAEIRRKFDEIVAFAEVERFLDTPVKRYSSGMYVRLAFAVAAHLEPEILVVDEVLAVGDAAFQKKCLGKMQDVGREGRTVLFVSHNMRAIRQLCDRAILLSGGELIADGAAPQVIERYLRDTSATGEQGSLERVIASLPEDPDFKLESIGLSQGAQPLGAVVENDKPLEIEIRYRVLRRCTGLRVYFDLCDSDETLLLRSFHDEAGEGIPSVEPGDYTSRAVIPANLLGPVPYELRIRATIFNVRSCLPISGVRIPLTVALTGKYNQAYLEDTFRAKFALPLHWETVRRP
ncbi:ABC transporter ATP-binding protein [Geomonas sp. Red69]|uniref:ABC transporter ATP-binding protein n=1 Tax=Geomonas diazotrophica TaxID=2843197 RepID=A0ABX8JKX6_9BACT|nr:MULTISPECIES: ABC transporter ATP-binding protein [Geomonas]MBU5636463.1 ABC transporter ATP-binding protein [Geomonas diazotrophica]QWV99034.1 ABC transporter ATP-binding protein [Geomonas nitrogeniifigens]QXE88200.1 ABC transporter ATP-binding protein [Geomonas nitrogeniifigens]